MPLTFSKTSLICIFLIDSIDKFPQFILDFLLFLFGANNLLALLLDCFRATPDHQLQFLNIEKTRTTNSAIFVKQPAAKSTDWISFFLIASLLLQVISNHGHVMNSVILG